MRLILGTSIFIHTWLHNITVIELVSTLLHTHITCRFGIRCSTLVMTCLCLPSISPITNNFTWNCMIELSFTRLSGSIEWCQSKIVLTKIFWTIPGCANVAVNVSKILRMIVLKFFKLHETCKLCFLNYKTQIRQEITSSVEIWIDNQFDQI